MSIRCHRTSPESGKWIQSDASEVKVVVPESENYSCIQKVHFISIIHFRFFFSKLSISLVCSTVYLAPMCFPSLKRLLWQPIVLPRSQHIPQAHVQGRLDTHSHNTHSHNDSRPEIDCVLSLLHKAVFTQVS